MSENIGGAPRPVLHLDMRIDLLERDIRDHSKSLTVLTDSQYNQSKRLEVLEAAHVARQIAEARENERDNNLYRRLDSIEVSVGNVIGGINKFLWIFGTALILAVVAYLVAGGFRIPS